MLDQNFSLRCALVWVAWMVSLAGGIIDWTMHNDAAGRSGVVFAAAACTLMVFNDNAKTRRAMRNAIREAHVVERPLNRVP